MGPSDRFTFFKNETWRYVDIQMEGIIYGSSSLYSDLVCAIISQLMIDVKINDIQIKYIVSDTCPPVSIHNDIGVWVFLDKKKS